MQKNLVKSFMTAHPEIISPDSTVYEAAKIMRDTNCGVLPVGSKKQILGMVTDRDIVVRAIAEGFDLGEKKVEDIMTPKVFTCREDETLQRAGDIMAEHNVGRLLVVDANKKPTGVISFGGIVRNSLIQGS